MKIDKPFGFDKKGPSIKQNRITTQHISDGLSQLNGKNIVMGKVTDLDQILYGYTISDSTPLNESEGMLDNNELAEVKYNDATTGLAQAVYVRIPLIHDHLEDPLEKEMVNAEQTSASQAFQGNSAASPLTDKNRNILLSSHTRCTLDPTIANPTTQIHKNQFVGIRFKDHGYKYAHIVTLPNQSEVFSAIASGDLSPIFGEGAGTGFSGASGGSTTGNYTANAGAMILIGASSLTAGMRVSAIQKRISDRGMEPNSIQIAKFGGALAFAKDGFELSKGGTNLIWFIPQLIKVLNNETEKQRYSNFKYVILSFPSSNDMLKTPGEDQSGVIANTRSAISNVGNQIDPISKKPLKDVLQPEGLGKWLKDCLKILCPSAEVIFCPPVLRWGGAVACQDYNSSFSYVKHLGFYENFKIIKHVAIGSHHVSGEDNTNRDTSITFTKIVGSGGTDEPTWNRGNGVTGLTKQTDAIVDIAQGVAKNHFLNSDSQYPSEPETPTLPIADNLRNFCKDKYPELERYLRK